MRPLFKVAEEVILCCKNYPEFNGDNAVVDIFTTIEAENDYFLSYRPDIDWTKEPMTEPSYLLASPPGVNGGGVPRLCTQSSLRKKHKPAEGDFVEFMTQLIFEPVEV